MRSTFRLIRRNPFGFLFATIISLIVVIPILVGLLWLPYVIYSDGVAKNILSKASDVMPVISKYRANAFTGECEFSGVSIMNSSEFDTSAYKDENKVSKIFTKREMLEIENMKIHIDSLSIFTDKPIITGIEIEISNLNAIRMDPRNYNVLKFMQNLSEILSTKNGKINKFVLKIKKAPEGKTNVSYLDFSASNDIINESKNVEFEFSKIGEQDLNETLHELSKECAIKLPYIQRAILQYLDK